MKHQLSDEHPLQPIRVKLAVDLIRSTGLIEHSHLLPPRAATIAELELVHSAEYVELVRRLSDPTQRREVPPQAIDAAGYASADNPISNELHEGTALVVGATLVAAEAVESGAALHAFSPSGGLHHAHRERASGFCTYDDPAIACRWLKDQGHRVAYVDVDVHHGDGVEDIFYSDPDVLTISLHESGRYLFTGTVFHELAQALCEGRWLALGGGGYAIYEVVPRAWTLFFAEMVERPDLAAEINDQSTVLPAEPAQERVWTQLRKDLKRLGDIHGMDFG